MSWLWKLLSSAGFVQFTFAKDALATFTDSEIFLIYENQSQEKEAQLAIPTVRSHRDLANPQKLHDTVSQAWDVVLENQAGLTDDPNPAPLNEQEATFQFERTRAGQTDSARFLLVFDVVPSIATLAADYSKKPLSLASASGDTDLVKKIITGESGAVALRALEEVREDGTSPAHVAASMGNVDVLRLLIESGMDVDAPNHAGLTPFLQAALMGHVEILELFVKTGSDVNQRHTFASSTALHFAAELGHIDVVSKLCELGADGNAMKKYGGTPIHVAVDSDQPNVVAHLCSKCNANPNALLLGDTTPVYLAAQKGRDEVLLELLKCGADIDFAMPTDTYTTHMSQWKNQGNHKDWSKYHQSGSDPNAAGFERGNGATALHVAAENGHIGIAKILLEAGAKQTSSMGGSTPLIQALHYNNPDIAILFAETCPYAHLSRSDRTGARPLHLSALKRYKMVVEKLLKRGADPLKKDKQGRTALELASDKEILITLRDGIGRNPKLDKLASGLARVNGETFTSRLKSIASYVEKSKKGKFYLAFAEEIAAHGGKWALMKLKELEERVKAASNELAPAIELYKKINVLVVLLGGFDSPDVP